MPREAFDADEREYENQIARQTAIDEALDRDTDQFMKYDITPEFIDEWLQERTPALVKEIHELMINGEDRLIGKALRRYFWLRKREELQED